MPLIERLKQEKDLEDRLHFSIGWIRNETEHHPCTYTCAEVLEILEQICKGSEVIEQE